MILILHNIRSVHNVGSVFRTADAAGISKIILSGYTPTPLDRFNLPRKDLAKVALGAEKNIPWIKTATFAQAAKLLKKENYFIAAIEQDKHSTPLFRFNPPKDRPLALVLGNEVRGVSPASLKMCDAILEIPMRGKKESLNVSVSAGIAMYELCIRP